MLFNVVKIANCLVNTFDSMEFSMNTIFHEI